MASPARTLESVRLAALPALREGPPLRLAVLFGSAAREALRPDSDVDLAILPRDLDLPLTAELDLQVRLEGALGRPVDLVRLDTAPLVLAWKVATEGVLVFAEPPAAWHHFRARTASEYLDFAPAYEEAARLYHAALRREAAR